MTEPSVTDWVGAIGTAIGGLAALLGVIIATLAGKEWRDRARATKQAEVAGQALGAVLSFIAALRRTSLGYRTSETQRSDVDVRWESVLREEEALKDATALAAVYLPDRAEELLKKLWSVRADMYARQAVWANGMETDDEKTKEYWHQAFGAAVREELNSLEQHARDVLKPLARIEK